MRWLGLALLVGFALGCASNPAEREAAGQAWAARDKERARECLRAGGRWNGSGCSFRD